ncbi:uncharacterized protein PGTG_20869 [Puccinia graminis f. sp. tritici CRL 75-36-700-3]|uniref:No apical meristem-associated C-terminal domain-containing protein n=1 Tax=Puccinia graminis f. sp. tritici (strain CRL 75-36-700-3 / race SCCL) TaxID=418459 RepID=H6QPK2_PUCGT|nr:uncharacterized protein PGTG_20869 [Puccinia graminis f. sp. tritici CRL 75-36-700-3]EHS63887.1 hypothetical protein PGTG_20869 [Puccinia graminis f. sp. tritici CRL 75-36-700-3]
MDSLNRDSRPRFSESGQFPGSNGLATRLAKGIQGHLDSPKPSAFVESPPNPTTQPVPQIDCPHRTFNMPSSSNNEVEVIDPALATMVEVVDVESSAQKTPVAKEKSNKQKENEDENTPVPKKQQATNDAGPDSKPKQPKPPKWQPEEDQSLCTSWLNTSKDAVVGTNQTKTTFWDRIYAMYLELMDEVTEKKKKTKGFKPFPTRLKKPLEDRWYHIQHQVSKYCGYYSQVERRMRSGSNVDDLVVEAKLLFKTDTGKNFNLDHCWGILHHSPKWIKHTEEASAPTKTKASSKKTPVTNPNHSSTSDASSIPSSSAETNDSATDDSKRPEGSKAAKKRKNDEINIADLIKGQKELLEISRQKQKSFDSFADDMVMGRDLSGMDEEMRAYFQAKRKKVMERLNNEN